MADYGITPTGFVRKRLPTIKSEMEAAFASAFGPVNTGPDSVNGQLIGIFSKVAADLWELAEEVYHSQYPNSAEGVSLENSAKLVGVTKLPATRTTVPAIVFGAEGLPLSAGKLAGPEEGTDLFEIAEDTIITRSALLKAVVKVIQVADQTEYTCSLNTVDYVIDSGTGATKESIAAALVAAVNNGDEPVTATDNSDGTYTLLTDDPDYVTTFGLVVDERQEIRERGSYASLQAKETGPVPAPAGALTSIVTPVSGWDAVINPVDGKTGRNLETDPEFRIRRRASVRIPGAAALSPMEARLKQEVDGVTYAKVYENHTLETVDGRPPKSIEAVVLGGDDSSVARKLWETKAGGIRTHGSQAVMITDSNNDLQEIRFTRPDPVYIWLKAELTLYDEESFPSNGIVAVSQALLEHGATLEIGEDVILQRFLGPVFAAVSGVARISLSVATSATAAGPAGTFSSDDLAIGDSALGDFSTARITVTIP